MMTALAVIAATLGIAGGFLVATRRPYAGHCLWAVCNPIWIGLCVVRGQWPLAAQFSVFEVLALIGLWNWSPMKDA